MWFSSVVTNSFVITDPASPTWHIGLLPHSSHLLALPSLVSVLIQVLAICSLPDCLVCFSFTFHHLIVSTTHVIWPCLCWFVTLFGFVCLPGFPCVTRKSFWSNSALQVIYLGSYLSAETSVCDSLATLFSTNQYISSIIFTHLVIRKANK